MESLNCLVELCHGDSEFLSFLNDLRDYVTGTFTASDLICVVFPVNWKLTNVVHVIGI